jgi:glucokinase
MVVDPSGPACNCGQRGCLEQFGSATAIARRARELAAKNPRGLLMKLAGGRAANISSRLVHEAALKGDPVAKQVMAETTRYLGIGVANLINIFNPQMVVLGGGVMGAGQTFLKAIEREARARAFETPAKTAKIVAAKLGDDMGVVGAAGLVFARG